MAKVRSPNYPNLSLGPALEALRAAFKSENRNKMSRLVLAKHLGYNSLNGRALGKIGAVRAYGLLDGSGDELRISDDAVVALNAPKGSPERSAALGRLALKPTLFQELRKDFPDTMPSLENLKFSLVKRQFTPDAAEKAAKSYLATMNLVAGIPDAYNPQEDEEGDDMEPVTPIVTSQMPRKQAIIAGERELKSGLLGKETRFRLLVTGAVGAKELERLIASLDLDKKILEDSGEDETE